MGLPAVVSNIPIFHEVGAGGALYFDPKKPKQFADRIKELDDEKLMKEVILAGKTHIASYTWDDSARTLLNTIKSML